MKCAIRSLSLLFAIGATFAYAQTYNLPIQHVIIVIQENRTPTNIFHEDGLLAKRGAHVVPPNNQGQCKGQSPIPLTGITLDSFCDNPDHSHNMKSTGGGWVTSCDADPVTGICRMDGACNINAYDHCSPYPIPNPQYTFALNNLYDGVNGTLDPYFHIAENYGFANYRGC